MILDVTDSINFGASMDARKKAYLYMHFSVFAWGFTAILGDLITCSAYTIVFWRVFITSISLYLLLFYLKREMSMSKKMIKVYFGIGVLIALHWVTFYGSIKLANASIALVCFATTSFFTSLIEPLIVKSKFSLLDLGIGLIVIPAMAYIVNGLSSEYYAGIAVGLLSAVLVSIFTSLNKKYVEEADPVVISFYEIGAATLFLGLVFPLILKYTPEVSFLPLSSKDWMYLGILALACTTLPFVLSMYALKKLSAFAAGLVVNLEPVYGIILAFVILQEHKELNSNFYIGSAVICLSVLIYPWVKKRIHV